jgi:hypothetical protein
MLESFFTVIALIICTTTMLIVLIIGRNLTIRLRFTNPKLVNLVFFFALYKVIAYYGLPLVMNIFSDFRYVREDGIELISLTNLYIIESLSWIFWLMGILIVASLYKKMGRLQDDTFFIVQKEKLAKWSITALAVGFVYFKIRGIVSVLGEFSGLPWFLEITKSLLTYAGPPASIVLMVIGFKRWGLRFGFLGLLTFLIGFVTIGTRGALVYSIVLFAYMILNFSKTKKSYLVLVIGFFIFVTVYFTLGGLPSVAISVEDKGLSSIEVNDGAKKKGIRSSIEEIEWRFGASSRWSTKFIEMYDRGDGAGINPIKNSILGFLPRSINPHKPIPSTVDGDDYYSQGMFMIYSETFGIDSASMVEFSTGGHAYWEFGWLGVLVLSTISGIYVGFCLYYFQKFSFLAIPLLVATFKPWGYVDPKIWVSDIILQIYQLIMPLILLTILYLIAKTMFRSFIRNVPKRKIIHGFI